MNSRKIISLALAASIISAQANAGVFANTWTNIKNKAQAAKEYAQDAYTKHKKAIIGATTVLSAAALSFGGYKFLKPKPKPQPKSLLSKMFTIKNTLAAATGLTGIIAAIACYIKNKGEDVPAHLPSKDEWKEVIEGRQLWICDELVINQEPDNSLTDEEQSNYRSKKYKENLSRLFAVYDKKTKKRELLQEYKELVQVLKEEEEEEEMDQGPDNS